MNEALPVQLRRLRLSGMLESLELRLQEAMGSSLTHAEFLELIVQDELDIRSQRALARRLKAADFREPKTLEDFDWSFNKSIKRKQMFELATCKFVGDARDVLFIGPPGVGKSHLCQAIGRQAAKQGHTVYYRSVFDLVRAFLRDEAFQEQDKILARYLRPDLLILDDMGMKQLPKRSGEFVFEIVMRRHQIRSTVMTSNRPIEEWGKLLQDVPSATAILDRFLADADVIAIEGRSYRMKRPEVATESK